MRKPTWLFFLACLMGAARGGFDSAYTRQAEAQGLAPGEALYKTHCAGCHHEQRIGHVGPPLLPEILSRRTVRELAAQIKNGFPATLMPTYEHLTGRQLEEIAAYIKSATSPIEWRHAQIAASRKLFSFESDKFEIGNDENLTAAVERNANRVWLMEDERKLAEFEAANVHGGIKFAPDRKSLLVPSRDGKITRYDVDRGALYGEVRACIHMRNISLDSSGKKLFAGCLLPETIEVFDAETLAHLESIPLDGKISALYELYDSDRAVFTLRDKPLIGFVDGETLQVTAHPVAEPIEDFFIEPFEAYMVGTSRQGSRLVVYDLSTLQPVFSGAVKGMPHLFSATWWYSDGQFFFATPHLGQNHLSVWTMYDWKLMATVDLGGSGFFARTHPATSYIWVDNGTDVLSLIDKRSFKVVRRVPRAGKKFNHTEFSADGKYAYLSIYENDGELIVLDTALLEEVAAYPAKLPVGKYNLVNKTRSFARRLLGEEVFRAKCWGCHHRSAEAFGPALAAIADGLDRQQIIAYMEDPKKASREKGYSRSLMPRLGLTRLEMLAAAEYIESFKTVKGQETLFVVQRESGALSAVKSGNVIGSVKDLRDLSHGVVKFDGDDGYLISRDGYVIKFDPIQRVKLKEFRTSKSAIGFVVEPSFLAIANYDDKTVEILDRDLNPIQKIQTGSKNVGIKTYGDYLVFALMDKDELWVMKNVQKARKPWFELAHAVRDAGTAPFDAMIRGSQYVVGFFDSPHFGVLDVKSGQYRKIALENRAGNPVLKVPHFGFWSIAKDRIFIPAVGDSRVHVFDQDFRAIASVDVAGNPVFTSLSPDEKRMAVTFSGKEFPIVQILDTASLEIVKTLSFDGSILHVRWSSEEPLLFLSNNTGHRLIALDTASWAPVYEVRVPAPSGIFIHKAPEPPR